jgi:BASS family bile acid:Na+ symporter
MRNLSTIAKIGLIAAVLSVATIVVSRVLVRPPIPQLWLGAMVSFCAAIAITLRGLPTLAGYQFTAWIVVVFVAGLAFPELLLNPGGLNLGGNKHLVPTIVQLVMFGVGAQMSLHDFAGVAKMPWSVFVGVICQFTIMPLVGFALTKAIPLEPEIAAGVILIGCCSSGISSNLMAYLARANLALSITMTSFTTILAPAITPMWMKYLAGDLVELSVSTMMADIIKIVIVPIGAAMLHDYLKHASPRGRRIVIALAVASAAWLVFLMTGGYDSIAARLSPDGQNWFAMLNYVPGGIVFGVLFHLLARVVPGVERRMPLLSMLGVLAYTALSTAKGRTALLEVGGLLFVAAAIHNAMGYVLGYWMSRSLGVTPRSARTCAFEVGLQNGGMATGIAAGLGKLGTMGVAAAVFSAWMNITGSILAMYWRHRPIADGDDQVKDQP